MHPQEFAQKWQTYALEVTEEQGYVDHYRDGASLVNGPVPGEKGAPAGLSYQAGVKKVGSTDFGKADVFLPGHFIWEAKRAQKTADARAKALGAAHQQATLDAYDLGNPPLIIMTDFVEIRIHTHFTATAPRVYRLTLDDIAHNRKLEATDLTALQVLHAAFHQPDVLNPARQRQEMTTAATAQIGEVAQSMVSRGHEPEQERGGPPRPGRRAPLRVRPRGRQARTSRSGRAAGHAPPTRCAGSWRGTGGRQRCRSRS